ncbi:MAG: L,D-transpeptidase [Devosia sp.]
MFRRILIALVLVLVTSSALARELLVTIDLSEQSMSVRVDGVTEHRWAVSTGRKGYPTPRGTFRPLRMYRSYFSIKYDNAPMPHAIFFHRGYAIHGTTEIKSLGRPASHGCVRLHPSNAALLYSLVKQAGTANTVIRIRN